MNSVHEPGPNGDSKISPSRKPVRKTKPDAQAPSRPSKHAQVRTSTPRCTLARPGAHWQAQARARLAVSWAGLAVSWPRPLAVSQSKPPCRSAPPARPCAPCRKRLAPRPLPGACRRPPWPYRERTGCRIVGTSRPCRRRTCRVAALSARGSRLAPSARAPYARLRAQPA